MKLRAALVIMPIMAISVNAQASIFDRLVEKLSKDIYSSYHGENLPKKVGESEAGLKYRQQFIEKNNIKVYKDDLGLTQFDGNEFGLALLKKGNDDRAFETIMDKRDYDNREDWKNGSQFIKELKRYTKDYGCIPKLNSLSHGWASGGRPGEAAGLSGSKGFNGFFATSGDLPGLIARAGTRTVGKHLRKEIEDGEIKFCDLCVAQFYACNIDPKFAKTFSEVTGCQAVVATGQNSPNFQSMKTEEDKKRVYNGAHYWKSAAGVWAERHTDEQKANGERKASWYRSTPIKNAQGKVIGISEENLGETYISL